MDSEHKWYLAARFLSHSLTADEESAWRDLLEKDPAFRLEFEEAEALWHASGKLPYDTLNVDADWKLVAKHVRPESIAAPSVQTSSRTGLKYAAAVAMMCVAGIYGWILINRDAYSKQVVATTVTHIEAPVGSKTFVTLPDSSTVWLNAGSKLSFNNAFSASNRDIDLEGEAFFDVVKRKIPFTVHTQQCVVSVLGTAFNVSAYPDAEKFVATLVRGSLKVTRHTLQGGKEEILLKPNEQVVLSTRLRPEAKTAAPMAQAPAEVVEKLVHQAAVNVVNETGWKDGWLAMDGESLEALAQKMERLYNITIEFEDEHLKAYRYNGRIRQLSLEKVLQALTITSPVSFRMNGQTVVFSENKNTWSKYQPKQTPRP